MRYVTLTKTLTAASANGICLSQSGTAGTALLINGAAASGGVATLTTQRRVLITSAGDDSGITFAVFGTNDDGGSISQTITGGNAVAVATALDFRTVTKIVPSGNTASTVTVGTNTTGSTPWKNPSRELTPFEMEIDSDILSGSATYSIEVTQDNFYAPATPTVVPIVRATSVAAATAATNLALTSPVRGWRLTVTVGTGTVTTTGVQAGIANY